MSKRLICLFLISLFIAVLSVNQVLAAQDWSNEENLAQQIKPAVFLPDYYYIGIGFIVLLLGIALIFLLWNKYYRQHPPSSQYPPDQFYKFKKLKH